MRVTTGRAALAASAGVRRGNKYHAKKTVVDGITFDSQAEARRYGALKLLRLAGTISALEVHPVYPLTVRSERLGEYRADFRYYDAAGDIIVEDVKSPPTRTAVYRLKRKLVHALYGITITEVLG